MKPSASAFSLPRTLPTLVKTPVAPAAVEQFAAAEQAPLAVHLPRLGREALDTDSSQVASVGPSSPSVVPQSTALLTGASIASSSASTVSPANAKDESSSADARLIVAMPQEVHRSLKIRCAERGITIRSYMLSLLKADGIGPS